VSPLKKMTTFLVITVCQFYSAAPIFHHKLTFCSSLSLLLSSLGCHLPWRVSPRTFYLSDLICPLFIVFFSFGPHPLGCHSGRSAPPMTPLFSNNGAQKLTWSFLGARVRGVSREWQGGLCPQLSIEWIFYGMNWLCRDIGPALFSKVILFSTISVLSATQSSRFEGDD